MQNVYLDSMEVLETQQKPFTGKDGVERVFYNVYLRDGLYPMKFGCDENLFHGLVKGQKYDFTAELRQFQGQNKIKLVKAKQC